MPEAVFQLLARSGDRKMTWQEVSLSPLATPPMSSSSLPLIALDSYTGGPLIRIAVKGNRIDRWGSSDRIRGSRYRSALAGR